jgi:hypothetical protein
MNNALFLFLILLLGLVLSSFLGGSYYREGLTNEVDSQSTMPQTGVSGDASIQTTLKNYYDNYNHFDGTSSVSTNGTTYYGPNGGIAKIITNADGTQSLQVTVNTNSSPIVFVSQPITTSPSSMTPTSTQPASTSMTMPSSTVFYGPNGNTATIVNTQQGTAIQVNTGNGTMTFTATMPNTMPASTESSTMSSTQYYGSTGTPVQSANYTLGYTPQMNTFTGPNGNTAYYAQGPMGNTVVDYSSSLPAGIPKSRIPPGEEDLYILKSQVVPPVCPACPNSSACPRDKPCPACPPCARCPEPSMTCKAVPNYSAANYNNGMSNEGPFGGGGMINNQYIPVPVLNDFSTFGS